MGLAIWHGYRWRGAELSLRSRIDFPPETAREWRFYPDLCIGGWTDSTGALEWLWDGMNEVYRELITRYPRRAVALKDEYLAAKRDLESSECACRWDIRLPDGERLCLAIVAIYDPNQPSIQPRQSTERT